MPAETLSSDNDIPVVQPGTTIVAADSVIECGQNFLATEDIHDMTINTQREPSTQLDIDLPDRSEMDATNELVAMRDGYAENEEATRKGYSARIFSALSMKEATSLYGEQMVRAAFVEELKNCIDKEVWQFLDPRTDMKGAEDIRCHRPVLLFQSVRVVV